MPPELRLPTAFEVFTEKFHSDVWVHGTSLHVQDPDQLSSWRKTDSGTRIVIQEGTSSWVHFAIPTTTVGPLSVHSVMLYFETKGTARVTAVAVFDGPHKEDRHDVELTGVQLGVFEVDGHPNISYGLGISVKVRADINHEDPPSVDFWAAGARFVTKGGMVRAEVPG